jgi:NAD(P)-dependent dehydrogenase (short-subunit alcohol dehydrogenase family)
MSGNLEGKVAVVTGGGRGVGRAYALRLAGQGAAVVVNDLAGNGESPAEAVVAEIEAAGGKAVPDGHSVAEFDGAKALMQTAVDTFGGLDIVIANAGIIRPTNIIDAKESDWNDVVAVHLNGTFNCIHHAAPLMIERGGGTIVTTGDIQTEVWFPGISSYRASKAAIIVLTQHAANELKAHNINVNSVMPGATETRMSNEFAGSLDDRAEGFIKAAQAHYDVGDGSNHVESAPPETVPPVGVFLCGDEARSISGYSFQMSGTAIGVVVPSVDTTYASPEGERWEVDELDRRIPELVRDKRSLLRI